MIKHADILARMPAEIGPSSPLGFVTHGVVLEEGVAQVDAMAAALGRLHHAIPSAVLDAVAQAPGNPQFAISRARDMAAACTADSLDPQPRQAYRSALAWLDGGWAEKSALANLHPVLAQRDPNLANHLWDGREVRLVDFEKSGRGDRAGELADFVEHISVWTHAGIDAEPSSIVLI
jgi:Ser/Thr protein kinase RdoA (MazF antagonist)